MLAVGLLTGGAALAYPTNNVQLGFNCTGARTPVPDNFVGLAVSRSSISGSGGYFRLFDPAWTGGDYRGWTNLLGQIGVYHIRVIGGYSGSATDPTPAQDDQFFATLAASGGTSVNYGLHCYCEDSNNPADNIASAVHILDTPADAALLESFAMDNEPNFKIFQECPAGSVSPWTFQEYQAQWDGVFNGTENGIAAAGFPRAPFSGCDCGSGTPPWITQFAINEAPQPHFIMATLHDYDAAGGTLDAVTMAVTNLSPNRVAHWQYVYTNEFGGTASWPNDSSGHKVAFRFTEFSAFDNGGGNTNGQNFSTALWELDAAHWWAQKGCAGINPFTRVVQYNSPIYITGSNYAAMPYAYGLKAFNLGGHGSALADSAVFMTNPASINVQAYGVLSKDGKDLFVTLINKTWQNVNPSAANVSVALQNFGPVAGARYCLLSSTPDGQAGDAAVLKVAYLGGATIPTRGTWQGQWKNLTPTNNSVKLVVQPATAVVIDIQSSPPILQARAKGANLILSWLASPQNFALQTTTNLAAPNSWATLTNLPAIVNFQNTITDSAAMSRGFYRLAPSQ